MNVVGLLIIASQSWNRVYVVVMPVHLVLGQLARAYTVVYILCVMLAQV